MSPLSSLFQVNPFPSHPSPGVNIISLEPSMFDDYHYQYHNHRYPTSSSTASSSSSSNLSCKLSLKGFHVIRRAATHNNNNNNNNKSSSHTAAAVADFAHLLDPAYHSPKQLAAFMSSNQVYVDTAGETHDPDFRLFAPSATHSPKRREFLTVLPSSSPSNMYGGGDDGVEEVEEDCFWGEEERYYNRSQQPRSSFDSYRSPSRASDPIYTYSNYRHFDQSYAYRPAMTTNEWQEEQQQQQPADVFYLEEEEVAEERQPRSQFRSFRRESNKLRRKRAGSESSLEQQQRRRQRDEMMFLEEEGEKGVVLDVGDDDECVRDDEREEKGRQTRSMSPLSGSTTHSFRRQWLALRLRTQFAAFRARRKMTKLVKCATAAA